MDGSAAFSAARAQEAISPSAGEVTLPFEPLPQFRQNVLEENPARADSKGKRIGIFIVTFNAITTLNKVLRRITPDVWRNVEQVVVFDDASEDATYELAVGIQTMSNLPQLRVLKHSKNLGYGGNQKAGYRYFIEQGFDIVVLLHGDGQYAPELLSHMYAPLVAGEADAVFGSRMMKDFGGPLKGGMPLYKYIGNRVLTSIENRALGLRLTEFHSGYRAYNLHALSQIKLDNLTDDFHFDTEIIIKLHHQGFRIKEVPIPTFYGDEICYVNGTKYAKAIVRSLYHYHASARAVRPYPEFEEYFVPYPIKRSPYSSHYYAFRLIGRNQRVLELGGGDGSFGAELVRAGNSVVASRLESQPRSTGEVFGRVLMLDTLEHLREPAEPVEHVKRLLAPRGRLIISVPNAVNFTVRAMVLMGRFNYSDRGILDWSHVRFFTAKSITALLEKHGYRITARHYTVIPLERVIPIRPDGALLRFGSRVLRVITRIAPGLLAYEIVIAAERADQSSIPINTR
ncbi:MAG: glycosyltransferase [Acidobacteriaceae bacterium]|nr:glycosyltransferase [Acidobacteriaceae bacterium]MBV9780140.1 glycosyltransferase [Acidobacteriaceae bacterium]